jgi:hypothetical protein
MKGWGVSADLGTKVDVRERTIGCYLDVVVTVGTEGHDEVGRVVIKSVVPGDGEEEVFLDVFFLWAPDLLTAFVDNDVLMRVVGDGGGTRWGSEEMREELGF